MAGITLPFTHALAAARELGASGWAASEMLMAIRIGMADMRRSFKTNQDKTCMADG
jgi:hypothetical protein